MSAIAQYFEHSLALSFFGIGMKTEKWMGIGELNSNDHYIYYCGKKPLEEL